MGEFDIDAAIRRARKNPFRVSYDPLTGSHISSPVIVPDGWGEEPDAPPAADAPDDDIVREFVLVKSQIKQLQARERELREILVGLDQEGADSWETGDGFAIRIRRLNALRLSDKDGFEDYATERGLWPQVGSINVSRISAWYRRNPAMVDEWATFVEPYEQVQFWTRGPEKPESS